MDNEGKDNPSFTKSSENLTELRNDSNQQHFHNQGLHSHQQSDLIISTNNSSTPHHIQTITIPEEVNQHHQSVNNNDEKTNGLIIILKFNQRNRLTYQLNLNLRWSIRVNHREKVLMLTGVQYILFPFLLKTFELHLSSHLTQREMLK